ncbi:MAG: T9SS C-terminal target domain-containing protein [Calditrichaeota bacterium]|nr:MAG: T9SS C-terminal target domain-containing protein [Calditrichota bacterium]
MGCRYRNKDLNMMKKLPFFFAVYFLEISVGHHFMQAFSQTNYWKRMDEVTVSESALILSMPSGGVWAATENGLFLTEDDGETWRLLIDGLPSFIPLRTPPLITAMTFVPHQGLFVGTIDHGIYHLPEGADTWGNVSLPNSWIDALACNTQGCLFAVTDGLLFSIDNGENCRSLEYEWELWPLIRLWISPEDRVFVLGLDAVSDSRTYLYRFQKDLAAVDPLYANGAIFINDLTFAPNKSMFRVQVQLAVPDLEDNSGIYRSDDSGDHWVKATPQTDQNSISVMTLDSSGHVFCGGNFSSIWKSSDNGDSWETVNSELADKNLIALEYSPNGYLFAAASGDGLYRSVHPVTYVDKKASQNEEKDMLYPVYPNPVQGNMNIAFYITSAKTVQLNIYNLLGQRHTAVLNGFFNGGEHHVSLNADDFAAGIYWIGIQTSDTKLMHKVVVLR